MTAALALVVSLCCTAPSRAAPPPVAATNDNRVAAGRLTNGTQRIRFVAQRATWHPDADGGPSLVVETFGEEGKPPAVPAPLIRVRMGTPVSVTIRNALADTLLYFARCFTACHDSLIVAPGATGTFNFTPSSPGNFTHWAAVLHGGRRFDGGAGNELEGAVVVDSVAAPPPDRVLVIGNWHALWDSTSKSQEERLVMTINGKMWPHTERFHAAVGDSVRWRIINASGGEHPMHLHGFFFRVDARGNGDRDSIYAAADRRLAVTEDLPPLATMSITWSPDREGNWVFHCHKALHMTRFQRTDLAGIRPDSAPAMHVGDNHATENMSGLVIGIDVHAGAVPAATVTPSTPARRFRLLAQSRKKFYGADPAMSFVLQGDKNEPSRDSVVVPSPTLLVHRGEPVEIEVVNRLDSHTGVHWHGIELESYFDGVAGWSGGAARIAPLIAPGDSFTVKFTPPRAGTFIYHSHAEETKQIPAGLYGALIVLEPGQRWNDTTDHLLVIGQGGQSDSALIVVNGLPGSHGLDIKAGVPHRFRVINISIEDEVEFSVLDDSGIVNWRLVAKDGADRPASLRAERPAKIRAGPGETFDFELTPKKGDYRIQILSYSNVLISVRAH
ncbi:MAG: multicopper oxidase domain-containing protein [Gemmatimonadota bacterium]|nr:multicopper oxidase domain-containing protein [Gemmatimonadota bacterium]